MAQMERNVNLEEIDADALFGIDALKGQSILQKLIFFCCLLAGIVANVCMPMFLHTPRVVCVFLFLGCILVGIAFGCNYTETGGRTEKRGRPAVEEGKKCRSQSTEKTACQASGICAYHGDPASICPCLCESGEAKELSP